MDTAELALSTEVGDVARHGHTRQMERAHTQGGLHRGLTCVGLLFGMVTSPRKDTRVKKVRAWKLVKPCLPWAPLPRGNHAGIGWMTHTA